MIKFDFSELHFLLLTVLKDRLFVFVIDQKTFQLKHNFVNQIIIWRRFTTSKKIKS
jgi:hypothetical protein